MSDTTPPADHGSSAWGGPQPTGSGPQSPLPAYGPPPGYGEPLLQGPGGAGSEPPGRTGRRRGLTVVAVTAVLALVATGGAFAFYKVDPLGLFRSGPQAAEAIPADALFYVGLDLDPSATQKVNALRFLNHFPAFKEETGLDDADADVREQVLADAIDSLDCADLSYADDIEPWLGSKFAVAGMAPADGGGAPDVVGAIEVTDQSRAEDGLTGIAACASSTAGTGFGFAFSGDYAVVAQTQDLADRYAADADDSSLADDGDFQADMDALGGLGVATGWADVAGAVDTFGSDLPAEAGVTDAQLDLLTSTYSRAAATFRFEADRAQLVTSVFGDTPEIDHGDNQIVDLPSSTTFAMSDSGGKNRLDASWDDALAAAQANGIDVEQEIADFESETGFVLPDDLATILGDNLLLALDSDGLTADLVESGDPSAVNAGIRFTGDPVALADLYDRILALVQESVPGAGQDLPFTKVDADDGLVMATNDTYAETLQELGGDLGDSEQFRSVTEDAASKEFVFYFDWDSIEDQVLEVAGDAGADQETLDNIRPLRAFGITSETDGDYTQSIIELSVN